MSTFRRALRYHTHSVEPLLPSLTHACSTTACRVHMTRMRPCSTRMHAPVQECGTDALRFALCAYTAQGRDINLDIKRVVAYRHWCNKLWNAIKFGMLTLGDAFVPAPDHRAALACPATSADAALACRWMLSRLHAAAEAADAGLTAYEFAATTQAVYAFWQYDVCDTFIETIKPLVRVRCRCRPRHVVLSRILRVLCAAGMPAHIVPSDTQGTLSLTSGTRRRTPCAQPLASLRACAADNFSRGAAAALGRSRA